MNGLLGPVSSLGTVPAARRESYEINYALMKLISHYLVELNCVQSLGVLRLLTAYIAHINIVADRPVWDSSQLRVAAV